MKKKIGNFNELLKTLAQSGDPSAFFSLTESYFQARYQKERTSGVDQQDAKNKVLAEATELLEQLRNIPPKQFDVWFEEHCTMLPSTQSDQEEILLDKKLLVETNRFLNECAQELVRTGSVLRRKQQRKKQKFPNTLLQNRFFLPIGIPVVSILVCCIVIMLMGRMDMSFTITFSTPKNKCSMQIPPQSMMSGIEPQSDTVHQKNDTTITLSSDSAKKRIDSLATIKGQQVTPQQSLSPKRNIVQPSSVGERHSTTIVSRPPTSTNNTPPLQPTPAAQAYNPPPPPTVSAQQAKTEETQSVPEPPANMPITSTPPPSSGTAQESENNNY
jgi:hypothetical protein